jgi:hypothetical protein
MRVRPDPLILGKEFAEEGGGAVSHPDGEPGGAGSMFIPQLACQSDLPSLPRQIPKGSGYYLVV